MRKAMIGARLTRWRRLGADVGGNVAATFALLLVPIVGGVGAAVDYSQANSARTAMQASVDATALILSKEAAGLSDAQITKKGLAYFKANFHRDNVSGIKVSSVMTTGEKSQLKVAATGSVPTHFMGIMGFKTLKVGADSVVKWGNTRVRVALALDNTGSMASSGKMTALKAAASSFITQMQSAAKSNGDVYVSIIPFANDVNVGAQNYNSFWVDFKAHGSYEGWDALNGQCSTGVAASEKDCKTLKGVWTPNNHNTWNGCVTDRDKNNDTTNTAPKVGQANTLFPAAQEPNCPVELMALSYDWVGLKNKINSMTPKGNTNQTIGLQWAFQSLTSAPFTIPAFDPKYKYQQIMILFTDGLNTENRTTKTDPLFDTPLLKQQEIDKRTAEACKNIKAAGITLYTVQVNTDGDPTSKMLQDCASAPDKFFLLTSSSAIVSTFSQIATQISMRRISE